MLAAYSLAQIFAVGSAELAILLLTGRRGPAGTGAAGASPTPTAITHDVVGCRADSEGGGIFFNPYGGALGGMAIRTASAFASALASWPPVSVLRCFYHI